MPHHENAIDRAPGRGQGFGEPATSHRSRVSHPSRVPDLSPLAPPALLSWTAPGHLVRPTRPLPAHVATAQTVRVEVDCTFKLRRQTPTATAERPRSQTVSGVTRSRWVGSGRGGAGDRSVGRMFSCAEPVVIARIHVRALTRSDRRRSHRSVAPMRTGRPLDVANRSASLLATAHGQECHAAGVPSADRRFGMHGICRGRGTG